MECTFFWICKQSRQLPWRTPRQRRIQWNCAIIYILSAVNTEKRRIQKRRLCKKDWFVLLCFFGAGAGVINVSTWTFSFWSRKNNHLPAKNKLQSAVKIIMIMIICTMIWEFRIKNSVALNHLSLFAHRVHIQDRSLLFFLPLEFYGFADFCFVSSNENFPSHKKEILLER